MKTIYTIVPEFENIELIDWYKEFEWYYPDCELSTEEWIVNAVKPE